METNTMDDQRWKSWFPGVCRRQISTFIPAHIVKMWENSSGETFFYCYMLKNLWESGNTFQKEPWWNNMFFLMWFLKFISVIALNGRAQCFRLGRIHSEVGSSQAEVRGDQEWRAPSSLSPLPSKRLQLSGKMRATTICLFWEGSSSLHMSSLS